MIGNSIRSLSYYFTIIFLIGFIFIIFCNSSSNGESEDNIYFYYPSEELNETSVVYKGEYELGIFIFFGNNCTNWSVQLKSTLFEKILSYLGYIHQEQRLAGESIQTGLEIDHHADLGDYPINIFFNYTNEAGKVINKIFSYTITYIQPYRIINLELPSNNNHYFSLTIETLVYLSELFVVFDSDGDIRLADSTFSLKNVSTSTYVFSSVINRDPGISIHNSQEVGYHIIGRINDREFEQLETNINISINWDNDHDNNNNIGIIRTIITIVILLLLLVFVNLYILKKKRNVY